MLLFMVFQRYAKMAGFIFGLWLSMPVNQVFAVQLEHAKLTVLQNFDLQEYNRKIDKNIEAPGQYSIQFENRLSKINKRAKCSLKTLFSSERESWAFETFAVNGLFPVIAKYQKNHPSTVFVTGGKITLPELHACLNDPAILSKKNEEFTLKYPLIINANAALILDKHSLSLLADTGALIINLGMLKIVHSQLSHSSSKGIKFNNRNEFRGFVTSWADSSLYIAHSKISGLGFSGHLAGGIALARSKHQTGEHLPAHAHIDNVIFDNVYRPVWADSAKIEVLNSTFNLNHNSALALKNSYVNLYNNTIDGVQDGDGIKISNLKRGKLLGNIIRGSKESGVKINGLKGVVELFENHIFANGVNGISATNPELRTGGSLIIKDNILQQNKKSGVSAVDIQDLTLLNNRLEENGAYGISAWTTSDVLTGEITFIGNHFFYNFEAAIKTERISSIVLLDNVFRAKPIQSIFRGDLMPVQSQILRTTLGEGIAVQYQTTN